MNVASAPPAGPSLLVTLCPELDGAPVAVAAVAGESDVTVSPFMHAPSKRPCTALAK